MRKPDSLPGCSHLRVAHRSNRASCVTMGSESTWAIGSRLRFMYCTSQCSYWVTSRGPSRHATQRDHDVHVRHQTPRIQQAARRRRENVRLEDCQPDVAGDGRREHAPATAQNMKNMPGLTAATRFITFPVVPVDGHDGQRSTIQPLPLASAVFLLVRLVSTKGASLPRIRSIRPVSVFHRPLRLSLTPPRQPVWLPWLRCGTAMAG